LPSRTPGRETQVVIEDLTFARPDLPRELEIQVLAFMRIVWGEDWSAEDRFRTRLWRDDRAVHFVRADGNLLVSHAQIVVPDLERAGRPLRIAGVGGVMTYPQFRGEGHGTAVMRRATDHIRTDPSFDVGMLFCDPDVIPFYERFGWMTLPGGRVIELEPGGPEDVVMTVGDATVLPDVLRLDGSW
jgi:GNAT superfamily N-acetyltransferase